jgi:DtxR family Mn-dependent transcriptional regulator
MTLSFTEENYLKAILHLSGAPDWKVSTNAIAFKLETSAASVTDMLKKLSDKKLITYQRYKGASLTQEGQRLATTLLRKHRLWEVFLVQSLKMSWDEVHEIAGELEHIQSEDLIEHLDVFLGHPKFDPHGNPIPNAQGKYTLRAQVPLSELKPGQEGMVIGVREHESSFLKHLNEKGISLGKYVKIITNDEYDNTLRLIVEEKELNLSGNVARNIMIKNI